MVNFVKDLSNTSFFFAGVSAFTLLSFIGRAVPDMSWGIFCLFCMIHAIALIFSLICIGVAIGHRDPESSDDGYLKQILIGCIPGIALILTLWIGCGLGFWIGG